MDLYDFSRVSVLVVDDSDFLRKVLINILHAMRIDVVRDFSNVNDAMHELKHWRPDLMFIDWEMDKVNGIQMIRAIRRRENPARECPIIMIPAFADTATVKRARNAGADYTITKPFSVELIYRCMVHLRNSQREFFETGNYYGPDRRRRARPFEGPDRRAAELPAKATATGTAG